MDFEVKTLEELCLDIVDCPHSTPRWLEEGIPVIRNYNIKNGKLDFQKLSYVDEETFLERNKRATPEAGDLIISREAPMGEVCLIPENLKCCLGQRLVLLKVNRDIILPEYLLYIMQTDYLQSQIKANDNRGSIVSNLNIPYLKALKIPYVNKRKQQEVVKLLCDIDAKIVINDKIRNELEQTLTTIFDFWFLQAEFPDNDGNPYKSSGGPMVWNDKLKVNIPKNWSVSTLEGLVEIEKGVSYTSNDIAGDTGIPMINLASIDTSRNYKPDELKCFSGKYKKNKTVHLGDMLIACTDLTRNAKIIGSPILVPNIDNEYLYSMDLAKIKSINPKLDDMYLYMALRTSFYHEYIINFASGTNVLHLDINGIKWYPLIIPCIELQLKFKKLVEDTHLKKCSIIKENQELLKLRKFILPLLMHNQISFKNVS